MHNKSKKLLKLGNFVYGNKIQILLIDTDKLFFLKRYKNFNSLIKVSLNDQRICYLLYHLIRYKLHISLSFKLHFRTLYKQNKSLVSFKKSRPKTVKVIKW